MPSKRDAIGPASDRWTPLPLTRITPYNHDTSLFECGLPPGAERLDLPVCGCLLLLAPDREHGGGDAVRPYTPVRETPVTESCDATVV